MHSSSAIQADHKGNGSLTIFQYIHVVIHQTATAFSPKRQTLDEFVYRVEIRYTEDASDGNRVQVWNLTYTWHV